jgi:hypothetical protein
MGRLLQLYLILRLTALQVRPLPVLPLLRHSDSL